MKIKLLMLLISYTSIEYSLIGSHPSTSIIEHNNFNKARITQFSDGTRFVEHSQGYTTILPNGDHRTSRSFKHNYSLTQEQYKLLKAHIRSQDKQDTQPERTMQTRSMTRK
jgi:hypothetical protein